MRRLPERARNDAGSPVWAFSVFRIRPVRLQTLHTGQGIVRRRLWRASFSGARE